MSEIANTKEGLIDEAVKRLQNNEPPFNLMMDPKYSDEIVDAAVTRYQASKIGVTAQNIQDMKLYEGGLRKTDLNKIPTAREQEKTDNE